MKQFKNLTLGLCAFAAFIGCVSDDKFETPKIIDGGGKLTTKTIPYGDQFEAGYADWQFVNAKGTQKWVSKAFSGNTYMQMSAYVSGATQDVTAYMISPQVDFDTQVGEFLTFDVADGYSNGNPLSVMYSPDYDGTNFSKATWTPLTIPNAANLFKTTTGYGTFKTSGVIDLSGMTGKGVIAIVYTSGGKISSTAQVDNVVIGTITPNVPPVVSNLAITGTKEVNSLLTATYTFSDADAGATPNDKSTYSWYRADDATGTNKIAIAGATAKTYTLVAADLGKYISVEVVPNDGIDNGTTVAATYVGPIAASTNQVPTASNVIFAGTIETGQTVTGSYTYADPENSPEGTSTFQWYYADDAVGTNKMAITGATAKTYTITTAVVGKYISFGITPNDGSINGTEVLAPYQGPVVGGIAPSNLVVDGSLEAWPLTALWLNNAVAPNTLTQETTNKQDGNSSAKLTGAVTFTQVVPVTAGSTYKISLWYNILSGDGTDARIWSNWKAGTTALPDNVAELKLGGSSQYFPDVKNQWIEYTVTIVAPATADALNFSVRSYGGSVVLYDNFSVIEQ